MKGAELHVVFSDIYRRRLWGDGESVSGPGSGLARTELLRADIAAMLRRLRVRSVLDAGCGDFHWMQATPLEVEEYIGAEVVPELVDRNRMRHGRPGFRFVHCDITRDPLPRVDLILCRDVLPHLALAEISAALVNFKQSGSDWLLTNTFIGREENIEIATGDWRPVNLERPPFCLPLPTAVIDEQCHHSGGVYADKRLSLWSLAALVNDRLAQSSSK